MPPAPLTRPCISTSMKVPPKRKGNDGEKILVALYAYNLNESPSEKEGKFRPLGSSSV